MDGSERRMTVDEVMAGAPVVDVFWDPHKGWSPEQQKSIHQMCTRPIPIDEISDRRGPGGQIVHYVEGGTVISLANETFKFNGWNNEIKSMTTDFCYEDKKGWAVGVSVIMRVTLVDGSYHEDIGFGASVNARSRGDAIMQAKKASVTDALKRTMRLFGDGLGNCVSKSKKRSIDEKRKELKDKTRASGSEDAPVVVSRPPVANTARPAIPPAPTASIPVHAVVPYHPAHAPTSSDTGGLPQHDVGSPVVSHGRVQPPRPPPPPAHHQFDDLALGVDIFSQQTSPEHPVSAPVVPASVVPASHLPPQSPNPPPIQRQQATMDPYPPQPSTTGSTESGVDHAVTQYPVGATLGVSRPAIPAQLPPVGPRPGVGGPAGMPAQMMMSAQERRARAQQLTNAARQRMLAGDASTVSVPTLSRPVTVGDSQDEAKRPRIG